MTLTDGSARWVTSLVNLSASGACVRLPEGWPAVDPARLWIVLDFRAPPQTLRCEPVWGTEDRLGLHFLESDSA